MEGGIVLFSINGIPTCPSLLEDSAERLARYEYDMIWDNARIGMVRVPGWVLGEIRKF